jgi:serine/threonine-protein kinase
MASVHLARMTASTGFSRLVAIKRLHREYTRQKDFVARLGEEARLSAYIRHANVIDTLDLAIIDGALSLVLEYVEGESLAMLVKRKTELGETVPIPIAVTIMHGVLRGLAAAHEARRDDGMLLAIVHRDVSPQNILVGIDGNARIIDFGIAKALDGLELTRPGEVHGKLAYMAPEQLLGRGVTQQVDVHAAGVVLWELLAGRRLFSRDNANAVTAAVLAGAQEPPSKHNRAVPADLDAIVMRALARDVTERYATASELVADLEPWRTTERDIGEWVSRLAAERLASTRGLLHGAVEAPARESAPVSAEPTPDEQPSGVSIDRTMQIPQVRQPAKPPRVPPALLVACVLAALLVCIFIVVAKGEGDAASFEPSPAIAVPVAPPAAVTPAEAPTELAPAPGAAAAPPSEPDSPEPAPQAARMPPARPPVRAVRRQAVSTPSPPPAASPHTPTPPPAAAPPADDPRASRNYR